MKKILILSGSPRTNGNSNILCDEFARGASEEGHRIERINAARAKVSGCLGYIDGEYPKIKPRLDGRTLWVK